MCVEIAGSIVDDNYLDQSAEAGYRLNFRDNCLWSTRNEMRCEKTECRLNLLKSILSQAQDLWSPPDTEYDIST